MEPVLDAKGVETGKPLPAWPKGKPQVRLPTEDAKGHESTSNDEAMQQGAGIVLGHSSSSSNPPATFQTSSRRKKSRRANTDHVHPRAPKSSTGSDHRRRLPSALTSFLSSYPHPCLILAASPLHDALIARPSSGRKGFGKEEEPIVAPPTSRPRDTRRGKSSRTGSGTVSTSNDGTRGSRSDQGSQSHRASSKSDEGLVSAAKDGSLNGTVSDVSSLAVGAMARAVEKLDLNPPGVLKNLTPLEENGRSESPSEVLKDLSGEDANGEDGDVETELEDGAPTPTPADNILSNAFATHTSSALSTFSISNSGGSKTVHNRNTLLEGGTQQSHHSSRTAEGAVTAMYEQKAAWEKVEEKKRKDARDTVEKSSSDIESNPNGPRRKGPRAKEGGAWGGRGKKPGEDSEIDADLDLESRTGPNAPSADQSGKGKSLEDLLKPIWSNQKWTDLVRVVPPKESEPTIVNANPDVDDVKGPGSSVNGVNAELSILSLLNRKDAQAFLALLVDAVEPLTQGGLRHGSAQTREKVAKKAANNKSASDLSFTVELGLNFPRTSPWYRPSSTSAGVEVGGPSSTAGPFDSRTSKGARDSNRYNPQSANSRIYSMFTVTPTLQVVAVLYPDTDDLVLTTIARNIIPPSTAPQVGPIVNERGSPNSTATSPPGFMASYSVTNASLAGSLRGEPQAEGNFSIRPTLVPTDSSISALSSRSTAVSEASTISAEHPGTSANVLNPILLNPSPTAQLLSSSNPGLAALRPLPTDRTPVPFPIVSPSFGNASGLMPRNPADMIKFPTGYVLEKARKRKSRQRDKASVPPNAGFTGRRSSKMDIHDYAGGLEKIGEPDSSGERERTAAEDKLDGEIQRESRDHARRRDSLERRKLGGENVDKEEEVLNDERDKAQLNNNQDSSSGDEYESQEQDQHSVAEYVVLEANDAEEDDELDYSLDRLRLKMRSGSEGEPLADSRDFAEDISPGQQHSKAADSSTATWISGATQLENTSAERTEGLDPRTFTKSSISSASLDVQDNPDAFYEFLGTTPMGRMIREFAWETTPLGHLSRWSRELRCMVSAMLASPFRSALWWGEENVLIYNDAYLQVAGEKHPQLLGKSGAQGWAEIWEVIGPLSAKVMLGETVSYYDHLLCMNRYGFYEETYHIWSFIPIRGINGRVLGYENPSFETTARVIAERRLATLRDLVQITALSRTVRDYCQKAIQSIAKNPYDLPFALLYTCETVPVVSGSKTRSVGGTEAGAKSLDASANSAQKHVSPSIAVLKLTLRGTLGVPERHTSASPEMTLHIDTSASTVETGSIDSDASSVTTGTVTTNSTSNQDANLSWPFHEACLKKKPVFISDLLGRTKGYPSRGWPEEVKNAVCIPISVEGDSNAWPRAILVVGLNPRRPWNEIYATFLHLLTSQFATGLLSVSNSEQEVARAEELIALDRAKTNFFSNVSHELRTPLTLILGPLEDVLACKDNLTPGDRERLLIVQRHGTRLLNMVNNLLEFSRLEGGRMEVTYRPVQLAAVTEDLASLFRAAIERGGIEYNVMCEKDPTSGQPVFLDMQLYEKVIFNLVGNAFKYTLSGYITVKVTFSSNSALLQVIDTGCGIEEKELGLIFDRFHRVEGNSRSREGTGIGLALTLELVKTLGGILTVESEAGIGSTFSVRFPRGHDHLPAKQVTTTPLPTDMELPPHGRHNNSMVQDVASWHVHAGDRQTISSPPAAPSSSISTNSGDDYLMSAELLNLKSCTVLLADDNTDLRRYIAGVLRKAFTVVEAEDGREALDYCLQKPPALIVTDVMMPRMDGRELLTAIRANPSTALIPVIFLSAQAGAEARVEALMMGADDYLVKPFQSRELLARVNVHLQLGKMRIELEKRVEERTRALIESEMRYRGLADRYSTLSVLSPVGIFMTDARGSMGYANPRWYEISGHPTTKPLSQWRDSVLPEDRPRAEQIWTNAMKAPGSTSAKAQSMEFRCSRGNWVQFEIRAFHESGSKRGFVGAITDISHQKMLEAAHIQTVEQRAADAEEHRKNSEQYIDMISHELRNPLSGVWQNADVVGGSLQKITDFIDEVRNGNVPDNGTLDELYQEMQDNMDAIESIILCASHQGRIADDILNVSKLNMGLLSVNPVPFQLTSKMMEVMKMFEVECQQKGITLSLDKAPSLVELGAEWIIADPSRLSQILINFLTNSVKYTSDSKTRTVTIRLEAYVTSPPTTPNAMRVAQSNQTKQMPPKSVWVVVGVQDSGKGLTSEDMQKLFARFSQANPKSDQYGGSGLGLYVSKKLVELHEGFIEVESVPGQGSTFRFAIPAALASPPPDSKGSRTVSSNLLAPPKRNLKRPLSSGELILPPFSKNKTAALHVLIVEDNLINQKVMKRQLMIEKFVVTVANDGQEALDILQAEAEKVTNPNPISIVLMDIEMPRMDGLTAIKELRAREKSGAIPVRFAVIAVTGNARQGQIDTCLAAGFDDIAIKPYRIVELLAQMERLTGRKLSAQ